MEVPRGYLIRSVRVNMQQARNCGDAVPFPGAQRKSGQGYLHSTLRPLGESVYMRMLTREPTRDVGLRFLQVSCPWASSINMPTYPLQLTCLGVIMGTPLLASVFVILRIYTRRKLNLRLSWGKPLSY